MEIFIRLGWRCLGWVWSWEGDVHQAGMEIL